MYTHVLVSVICSVLLPQFVLAGVENSSSNSGESKYPDTRNSALISSGVHQIPGTLNSPGATSPLWLSQADMTQQSTQAKPDYLESVTREAAQAEDIRVQSPEDVVRPLPGNTAPTHTPGSDSTRFNAIRSIVSEALSDSTTEEVDVNPVKRAPTATKPQRQRLREAVTNAPLPMESVDGSYLSTLKEEVSTTVVIEEPESVSAKTVRSASREAQATAGADLYTVRYGDSLWNIAVRVYGDGNQWQSIYNANRHSIADANMLLLGQILRVPNRVR